MSLTAELSIVVLLILLNGFFAMSELAIVSARRGRLKQLVDEGHKGAKMALALADDPASFLSIVQIGITVNSVLAGAFSGATLSDRVAAYFLTIPLLAGHSQAIAMTLTVGGVTYFNLLIGELMPKRVGLSYAEPIAIRVAGCMYIFARMAAPFVWILRMSSEKLLKLMRLGAPRDFSVTEEEVKNMIAEGTQSGIFNSVEKGMLDGVLRLADRTVRTIMTPRLDMVWLGIEDSAEDNKQAIRSSGYSRFPVARGDLEEILGIIYAKDILNAGFDGQPFALKSVMRPALIVPDTTTVLRLLDQFKHVGQHVAIVVDEYGSVEGMVSVTDILEAITGGMPERGQSSLYKPVRRSDGSWLIDGMTPVDEVGTIIGLKSLHEDKNYHTLAGFVIDKLGKLPNAGDHFFWEGTRFEVVDMDGRRVDKVLITTALNEESLPDPRA